MYISVLDSPAPRAGQQRYPLTHVHITLAEVQSVGCEGK